MMNDIAKANYTGAEVWTYPRQQIKHTYFKRFSKDMGWSSGPPATWFALEQGFKEIYLLGMDFGGVKSGTKEKLRINNIYKGN